MLLDELEEKGLVRRRQHASDGRVWWIALTAKGRVEIGRQHAEWVERLEARFADVSRRDINAASVVLERLAEVFDSFATTDASHSHP